MFSIISRLIRRGGVACESGQALVEYALILMLIALLTVAALQTIGGSVTAFLSAAAAGLGGA